jgi:hypothetical protein
MFRKLDLFPSSGGQELSQFGPLEKSNLNRHVTDITQLSMCLTMFLPEDGNRTSFRNVFFWKTRLGEFQKLGNPKCIMPSSESLRTD